MLTDRQGEAVDHSRSLVVTAGAGSGKTKVLVERYIGILTGDTGARPSNILALTFTEKAALEMRQKVRKALAEKAMLEPDRFEPMLQELESADISTIHSFCARLVRSEPLVLGVDPEFKVLSEARSATLLQEAIYGMLSRPGPESQALRRLMVDIGPRGVQGMLKGMVDDRSRSRLDTLSDGYAATSIRFLDASTRTLMERAGAELPELERALGELRSLHLPEEKDRALHLVEAIRELDPKDPLSGLAAMLPELLNKDGGPRSVLRFGSSSAWKGSTGAMRDLVGAVFSFSHRHKKLLRYLSGPEMRERAKRTIADLALVHRVLEERYLRSKLAESGLDFDDLVDMALRLLEDDVNGIRTRSKERYTHIMIDEFQDTDPNQWRLVEMLWDGRSRLFLVGDPKQSIYGFRSSDVRLFSEAMGVMEGAGGSIVLDMNFRSRSEIMRFVNALFPGIMAGGGRWEVPFESLEAHRGDGGTVSIIGVGGKDDEGFREGLAVARYIKGALREGWTVTDPESGLDRPLRPGDVAVLMRARTGLESYERAFRTEGLPFAVYKGKGFFERTEIKDVIRLLDFLCSEYDDEALASLLRGSFFRLTDQDLLRICMAGGGPIFDRTSGARPLVHASLSRWLTWVRTYPPHIALPMVMRDSDIYASMEGRREVRNIDGIIEMMMSCSGRDLYGIRDDLREMVANRSAQGEPPLSTGDSVSLMTVHAAKGLEWPMVAVVGMHHIPPSGRGSLRLDPDNGTAVKVVDIRDGSPVETPSYIIAGESRDELEMAETKRLLYVACTRARDHLLLSGMIPSPEDARPREANGMMSLLMDGLQLDHEVFRTGSVEVGGVAVKLSYVGAVLEVAEDEEVPPAVDMPDLSLIGPVTGRMDARLSPSRSGERHRFSPGGEGRLSTPDQFGSMVHEVLMGRNARRVCFEHGFPEEEGPVSEIARKLEGNVPVKDAIRVLNEVGVVTGNGSIGRIDRLLIMESGVRVVIDFKTGERDPHHRDQVRAYMDAVGPGTSGYLVYPDGNETVGTEGKNI